jgi:hypothetical protein
VFGIAAQEEIVGMLDPVEIVGMADPIDIVGIVDPVDIVGIADPADIVGIGDPADIVHVALECYAASQDAGKPLLTPCHEIPFSILLSLTEACFFNNGIKDLKNKRSSSSFDSLTA